MAKIRPARVKILEESPAFITLLFLAINQEVKVSKLLFEIQKKSGFYVIDTT